MDIWKKARPPPCTVEEIDAYTEKALKELKVISSIIALAGCGLVGFVVWAGLSARAQSPNSAHQPCVQNSPIVPERNGAVARCHGSLTCG
jgi:hypothetical protein